MVLISMAPSLKILRIGDAAVCGLPVLLRSGALTGELFLPEVGTGPERRWEGAEPRPRESSWTQNHARTRCVGAERQPSCRV